MMQEEEQFIEPEQACIGLYIHLDLGWMEHPFTFNSFRIKDAKQLETLRMLGLPRIRYSPEKSIARPLPRMAQQPVRLVAAPPQLSPLDEAAMRKKKTLIRELDRIRNDIEVVERQFQQTAATIRNITRNIHSRPQEAYEAADTLVTMMVKSMLDKTDMMMHALNSKMGDDIYFHSLNVTVLSLMLARMLELTPDQAHQLGMGAIFHDIGKTEIPQKILLNPGPLSRPEQSFLEKHVDYGIDIARKVGLSPGSLAVVSQHHECVDGTGYPRRLAGDEVGMLARIVAIANTYDNLCNPANMAAAMTPYEALSHMFALKRSKFDERMLKTFIRCLGVYPPGNVVVLSNDMLGLVLSVNPNQPMKPNVLVYDPNIPAEEALIVSLDQEPELSISKSLRQNELSREVLEYLKPRKHVTYYFDPKRTEDKR